MKRPKQAPPETDKQSALLDAGLALFARKGFGPTTIDDIVFAVGCGKGTFYRYFQNKQELLDRLIERHLARLAERLEKVLLIPRSIEETLFAALKEYAAFFRSDRDLCCILEEQKLQISESFFARFIATCRPHFERLVGEMNGAMEAGRFRKFRPDLGLLSLIGILHIYLFRELKLGIKIQPRDLREIFDLLMHGMLHE